MGGYHENPIYGEGGSEPRSVTNETPPLELFLTPLGGKHGWATDLVQGLEINKPVPVLGARTTHGPDGGKAATIRGAAKRHNMRVVLRTFNEQLWICRLPDAE